MNQHQISVASAFLCFFIKFSSCSNDQSDYAVDASINCGSNGPSAARTGRQWLGDVHPKVSSLVKLRGLSAASTAIQRLSSSDPVPHKTARISRSQFSYAFQLNSTGQKIIRLHFNPTPYRHFKGLKDSFTVEAGPFILLSNFSASLTADSLGMNTFTKEFSFKIQENQQLTLTFSAESSPSRDTYAFINGIEIISMPASLSYFDKGEIGIRVVGQNSMVHFDDSTALEIVHRLHIKQDPALSAQDSDVVFPKWGAQRTDKVSNNTWKMPVEMGFKYLIRLHFSKVGLKIAGADGSMFKILINDMIVLTNTEIVNGRIDNNILLYRDYMVVMRGRKQNRRRDILISFRSLDELGDGVGVLEGFEVVKLSNPDDSLASPNPLPPPRNLQSHTIRNLLSLLGYKHASATVAVAVISLLSIILHKLQEIWEAGSSKDEPKPSLMAERHCRRFSLAEIQLATRNFSSGLVIGRGGFGKVYKGLIDNEQNTVAVKRLQWNSRQGAREFLTEIETLSELRHMNLVSLIGYCSENSEMILVYEYMACGTLADYLYKLKRDDSNSSSLNLNWKQRLTICIGAARGLDYLHTGNGVIHRDVKASNILLDEHFIAKVSDFGLAKTEDRSKLQSHVSTQVKGTRGYFDPYYIRSGKLTRKSDTYAFGVVLFEVLCGRRALDLEALEEERLLSSWAVDKISKGEVDEIVASNLREEIWPNSLKTFVEVAKRCLLDEPKNRPTMSQIVLQLESALEQQDRKEPTALPNDTSPVANNANEDIVSSEYAKQWEESSPDGFTEIFNSVRPEGHSPADEGDKKKQKTYKHSPTDEGGRKKQKAYSPLRFWAWGRNRIKPTKSKELTSLISEIRDSYIKLPKFDLTSIATATNQFSPAWKIRDEQHHSVYKAMLPTGQIVEVKRYYSLNLHDLEEFKNEIFSCSSLNHRNIMNLLGYCIHENGEAILVYDYMEQGTLYDHLHKSRNYPITWRQRLQICIDAAKGLDYLHTGSDNLVIHRDVKTANILLNNKWMAKLSDFSNSKSWPSGERDIDVSTLVQGTLGYLDPEYFHTSRLTEKSDVYSYGVVLFEVLCGRPVLDMCSETPQRNLATWASLCFKEGKLEEIIDSNLIGQISPECLRAFAETAMACLNLHGIDRPTMRGVVQNLELAMQLHEPVSANVTLHSYLYNMENPPLSWKQRLQICVGAAKGLDCLHTGAKHVIIHHDAKTTNTLMDEKWVTKVYDFAQSRVLRSNRDQTHGTTAVRDTMGNLDTKYYTSMHLTVKSNIYLFGVLLLEVLSARKQVDLVEWAIASFRNGTVDEIIDSSLKGQIAPECLNKFVETAIACLSLRGIDQLTMKDVIESLESAMQLQEATAINEDIRLLEFDPSSTNQFSTSHKIGEGGFASVYKAVLPTGSPVTVKRFSSSGSSLVDQIRNEILSVANLYHQNIIKLLGYCIHEQEGMVVYEFMDNGSLDELIFDELRRHQLQWSVRFKVVIGIAKGVIYLHEESRPRTIHRNLNLSNILLDKEMNPKISGFGLARNIEDDDADSFGYTSPAYIDQERDPEEVEDVYSFGVLVLEILSGKRNNGDTQNLIHFAWKQWNKGGRNVFDLVDESLGGEFSEEEALRCIQVGLLCSRYEPQQRPTMASALEMLLGEDSSLQEKMQQSEAEFPPNGKIWNLTTTHDTVELVEEALHDDDIAPATSHDAPTIAGLASRGRRLMISKPKPKRYITSAGLVSSLLRHSHSPSS